jgi:hypothetical protein
MEPPVNRPTDPGSVKKEGASRGRNSSPLSSLTCAAIRPETYTPAVGVEGGSDCVGATRERGRLCLAFGSAPASFTSDFDLERRVRLGLGLVSTCSSTFAAADSAVAGADATAGMDFRPSPSSFASVDRCSEYAGAVRG